MNPIGSSGVMPLQRVLSCLLLWMPTLAIAFLESSRCVQHGISPKNGGLLPEKLLLRDHDTELQGSISSDTVLDRRHVLAGFSLIVPSLLMPSKSWADESTSPFSGIQADSASLASGLLESRVTENLLSPPSYGMETPDIFYPAWFQGSWKVVSKTLDVQAPCGIALFGGNNTYERARNEIGTSLKYDSRFISDGTGRIIADRESNVQSIAKAAMGQYSVLDIPVASPNKLTVILAPNGSPRMLKVDLLALNRRQETVSDLKFDCSEVTREIISPVNNNNNPQGAAQGGGAPASNAPILKEVETTSLYTYDPAKNEVRCQQRSATFLLPSQSSPMAYKMWEASRGRPIDTRFYDVRYTKAS